MTHSRNRFSQQRTDTKMDDAAAMKEIADSLNASLNVVPLTPLQPQAELERLSAVHRKAIAKYDQRAADAQKHLAENLAMIDADRVAEVKRHEAEMTALDERRVQEMERSRKDIEADQRLAASCRAALAELDAKP